MSALQFKRFVRPQLLLRIGRPVLIQFFEKFQTELASEQLALPPADLPDTQWAGALANLFAAPEHLPDALCEALYAIDEMATADGQEQLEQAVAQAGLSLPFAPGASRQDMALQVWLAAPALLARMHNRQRLLRLTAFEHFGAASAASLPPFNAPEQPLVDAITADLDAWFARHHRGSNTTRVELYTFTSAAGEREFWFLVRHGDTFSRTPRVEEQRTSVIYFRPQRDDVVVYSAAHNELRINARTRGERDLYVRTFGLHLRGSPDYFSVRDTYTLEPLRAQGADVLHPELIPGLDAVRLRLVEAVEDGTDRVVRREAGNLFEEPKPGEQEGIPRCGRLRRADFDLLFTGCRRPRTLQIRLPNVLKLRRHCDLHVIEPLVARFRTRPCGTAVAPVPR